MLYVGGKPEPICFSTISPCRHKGPPAVWQHLNPVLDYLQATYPQVSVLHFFSDGPCTQYKQRGNFFIFSTELDRRGFKAGSWNFFEASHGKGAPDGVGGALKRTADMMVAKGRNIPDAHELFKALTETNTTVKLFFVKSEDIESAMKKMPKQIPAVPGTMRIHQVITLAPGELIQVSIKQVIKLVFPDSTKDEEEHNKMSAACAQHGSSLTASASTHSVSVLVRRYQLQCHSQPVKGIHSHPVKGIHSQKRKSSGEVQSWLGSGACSDMIKSCIQASSLAQMKHTCK